MAIVVLHLLVSAAASAAAGDPGSIRARLARYTDISAREIDRGLRQGALHVEIDTDVDQETASLHLVRVNVPADFARREYTRPAVALETAGAEQLGVLGHGTGTGALQDLALDDSDLRDLERCRVGDCKLKLAGTWIREMEARIEWDAPGALEGAMDLYRRLLADYASAYRELGNPSLLRYEDKRSPVRIAAEFTGIVQESDALCADLPSLCGFLLDFPGSPEAGMSDELLWTLEDVGAKRKVLSLTHRVAYAPDAGDELVLAAKQIYANHYFESALGLTWLFPDSDPGRTWILFVYRARIDLLRGWGIFHGKIRGGIRRALAERLERAKVELEGRWPALADADRKQERP